MTEMGLQIRPAWAETGLTTALTIPWRKFEASLPDSNVWLPKVQIIRMREKGEQVRGHLQHWTGPELQEWLMSPATTRAAMVAVMRMAALENIVGVRLEKLAES